MDEGEEGAGEFIIACSNTSEVFEFIEESFDKVSFFVEVSVVISFNFASDSRWNDGLSAGIEDVIRIVAFVGDEDVDVEALEKMERLSAVVSFSSGKDEAHGFAEGIAGDMNLGRKAALAAT